GSTSATAPVAPEIIAGRPPTIAIVTAMVKEANRPSLGSTPAMIENAMASGIRASATTRPPSTSVRSRRGERSADRTDQDVSASGGPSTGAGAALAPVGCAGSCWGAGVSGTLRLLRSVSPAVGGRVERATLRWTAYTLAACAMGGGPAGGRRRHGATAQHPRRGRGAAQPAAAVRHTAAQPLQQREPDGHGALGAPRRRPQRRRRREDGAAPGPPR